MPMILSLLQPALQWLRQSAARRRDMAALRQLDARALADIGIDPSEISSIDAEWRGTSRVTRLRIVREYGRG